MACVVDYGCMRPDDLRAYAGRSWDLVEKAKLRFRAERFRKGGPDASIAVARRLRERFRRLHPEGPTAEARKRDFDAHVALKAVFERAAHAFRGR